MIRNTTAMMRGMATNAFMTHSETLRVYPMPVCAHSSRHTVCAIYNARSFQVHFLQHGLEANPRNFLRGNWGCSRVECEVQNVHRFNVASALVLLSVASQFRLLRLVAPGHLHECQHASAVAAVFDHHIAAEGPVLEEREI